MARCSVHGLESAGAFHVRAFHVPAFHLEVPEFQTMSQVDITSITLQKE
jgi:hypothetical protein